MKSTQTENREIYLQSTFFIDSDSPQVIDYARNVTSGIQLDIEKAIKLFYAVRDDIYYDPYRIDLKPQSFKASAVLTKRYGFCVPKAILLAAVARAENIPSRLGFADVKNHLNSERLKRYMQTDEFIFHAYTELFLENRWVKATPAFNVSLCEKSGVTPLEFDGKNDAIFHEYNKKGKKHLEYLRDRGQFADFPYKKMIEAWQQHYPQLTSERFNSIEGNFEEDVRLERN